ncbi:MAG: MarR family transcriptional regulator, transcriptional regulator for hemolysin [Actinomycetota bacterium]|jgi:MarR family transcriptional regulator for hemolysin|nr:MarR family transcriptional regulator, transcriptional regulator for hemolysin [Actinomycetota bacterium]
MASAEPDLGAPPRRTIESLLMATSRGMRRAYDNRLAGVGLKLSEAFLLAHVHTRGPMTQTQLAEGLGIGRAATGALIDTLERKGLVELSAHASDRRVWLVAGTERASPVVDEIAALDTALREEMWTGISRAERRALSEILVRLQGNLAAILTDQI